MLILSIDPGSKPGYALLDLATCVPRRHFRRALPRVLGVYRALPAGLPAVGGVVTEGQWLQTLQKKTAILTLSVSAGWQLCSACLLSGAVPYLIPVRDWRAALGAGSVTKEVLAERCKDTLLPEEHFPVVTLDCYDAILIGWGWFLAPSAPWRIPP